MPGTCWLLSYCFLLGIFTTQGSNPGLLLCRQMLYRLSHQGSLSSTMGSLTEMINKQLIGADCAAENTMIKQLTGTDQSVGRC